MLHVTIKDTKTNEVIYDKEVKVIAMQAVDETDTTRLRRKTDDARPLDLLLCAKATMKESLDVKKVIYEVLSQPMSEAIIDEVDDDTE